MGPNSYSSCCWIIYRCSPAIIFNAISNVFCVSFNSSFSHVLHKIHSFKSRLAWQRKTLPIIVSFFLFPSQGKHDRIEPEEAPRKKTWFLECCTSSPRRTTNLNWGLVGEINFRGIISTKIGDFSTLYLQISSLLKFLKNRLWSFFGFYKKINSYSYFIITMVLRFIDRVELEKKHFASWNVTRWYVYYFKPLLLFATSA